MSFSGTIAFLSGDNLGSQLIGGFKEGPGAHLKCRHFMGNSNDIKTMVIKPVAHFAKNIVFKTPSTVLIF